MWCNCVCIKPKVAFRLASGHLKYTIDNVQCSNLTACTTFIDGILYYILAHPWTLRAHSKSNKVAIIPFFLLFMPWNGILCAKSIILSEATKVASFVWIGRCHWVDTCSINLIEDSAFKIGLRSRNKLTLRFYFFSFRYSLQGSKSNYQS